MSILNDLVGDTLRESPFFRLHKIKSEYPLNNINPNFKSKKEKVDWAIVDLLIAIEVDGEHHYNPTSYGGITQEEAEDKFISQKRRDGFKDYYCIKAEPEWKLIRIPYNCQIKTKQEMEKYIREKI